MIEPNNVYHEDCLKGVKQMKKVGIIPDLVICDPPYEFEVTGGGLHKIGSGGEIKYYKIRDLGTNSFDFEKFIPKIVDLQKDRVNAYFFTNKVLLPKYLNLAVKRGLNFDVLVLRKKNPIPAKKSSYVPELEYIVFLRSKGVVFNSELPLSNYKKFFDVVIGHSGLKHPNQKPKELLRRFIKVSSNKNDLVLDCFMGSGSTLVAARELGRRYLGFDIDKEFVMLAIKDLSGAVLHDWF